MARLIASSFAPQPYFELTKATKDYKSRNTENMLETPRKSLEYPGAPKNAKMHQGTRNAVELQICKLKLKIGHRVGKSVKYSTDEYFSKKK